MTRPLVVYLDTQDFSRFGDVLRGKGDQASERLFVALEERRRVEGVVFAISMPLLAELLQYHPDFRETTLCKAEAVERLCRGWALAFPSRLVAAELAAHLQGRDSSGHADDIGMLSAEHYWYPDISEEFVGFGERIKAGVPREVAAMGFTSRKARRSVASMARKMDPAKVARDAAPEMAATYGLPERVFHRSIVAYLRGRATPQEASRQLFGAIAEPVKFVETYFERVESDRSLPRWMRNFGASFEANFKQMRDRLQPYIDLAESRSILDGLLNNWGPNLAAATIRMGSPSLPEFGVTENQLEKIASDPASAFAIPAGQVVGTLLPAYARQVMAAGDDVPKIEHSFGGDLVHALYLPHVDLWRADRRFGTLVHRALPRWSKRVVSAPSELVGGIDRLLSEAGR